MTERKLSSWSPRHRIWVLFLAACDICLFVLWIATIRAHCYELGATTLVWWLPLQVMVIPVFFFVLFLAEGFEIAAANLLDKDPQSITSEQSRQLLEALHQDPHFFFAQRQIFVVVIISFITLATAYDYVDVPGVGKLGGFWATLFSLLFTTLNVLWFAQVWPKRLALLNPELFLKWSSYRLFKLPSLWKGILFLSKIDLPALSDLPLYVFPPRSSTAPALPPRPSFYYQTSLLRRRAGWHRMKIELSYQEAGRQLQIRAWALFVTIPTYFSTIHGGLGMFEPQTLIPAPTPGWGREISEGEQIAPPGSNDREGPVFVTQPTLTVLGAYTGYDLSGNTFDQLFDRLFEGQIPAGVTKNTPFCFAVNEGFQWQVHGGPPTIYFDEGDQARQPGLLEHGLFTAVLYETEAVVEQRPESGQTWMWGVTFDLPSRGLRLTVTPPPGQIIVDPICVPYFSMTSAYGHAPPPPEGMHGQVQADGTAIYALDYPETGTTFHFQWDIRPSNA